MDSRPCDDTLSQDLSNLEAMSASQVIGSIPPPKPLHESEVNASGSSLLTRQPAHEGLLETNDPSVSPKISPLSPNSQPSSLPTTTLPSKESISEQSCDQPQEKSEDSSSEKKASEPCLLLPKQGEASILQGGNAGENEVTTLKSVEKLENASTGRTEKEEEDDESKAPLESGKSNIDNQESEGGPFLVRQFETLESAEAALEQPAMSDGEGLPQNVPSEASMRRRHTTSGARASVSRHSSKRTRSSAASTHLNRDDDDTEMSDGISQQRPPPKKRARVTESSRSSVSGLPASELSLDDLPSGWTAPLLFFATMTKKQSWKLWKALPERRVCNGAIWLSPTCTGTPGLDDHVDGPTAILRDLASILQTPSTPIKLHENNYTSLARANVRASVATNKITTEFGVTRVIKAFTEKEYIQRLPLDLICSLLVQQLRLILGRCKRFPSHLFASDIHIYQHAPTLAFHLRANEVPISLASLLTSFGNESTLASMEVLKEDYRKHIGTRTVGSRRRGEGLTTATASFFMTNDTINHLNNILDTVQSRLDEIKKIHFGPPLPQKSPVKGTAYAKGDLIVKDLPVRLLPRSAAALRDRTYDFYDIPSYIIYADVTHVQEEDKSAFNQAIALHVKEDSHWLDSITAQYLDLTLTEEVEAWLVGKERWQSLVPPPSVEIESRTIVHNLVSHTSSVTPNAEIVISLKATAVEEKVDKMQARNRAYISIRTTRDIGPEEAIVLDPMFRKVTWAELADDDSPADTDQK